MSLESWINTLELLLPIAKAVPVLGSPVEGSLEAAVKILQFAQGVKTNKERTKELAEQAARWTQTLVNALDGVETDTAKLERMQPNVTPIREVLDAIAKAIERRANESKTKQILNKSRNEQELTKLRAELTDAYNRFMVSTQILTQSALSTLLTTGASLLTAEDTDTLGKLAPVSSARYDSLSSPSGCLQGTRQDILAQMLAWVEEPCQVFSVFWLAGLAGTGKSSIAKTFCEQLAAKSILMATFFASRNSAERRDPFHIIHTLAYELSITDSRVRPQVLSAIRSPPDIMQRPMQEQIERLLAVSLSQAQSGRTLVLVIDALDECDKIGRVEGGSLIPLLAETLRNLPVKLLVTSRQEKSLEGMFNSLAHIPFRLHEVATGVVEPDVRQIFETGFADIRREHELTVDLWPSEDDIDSLVRLTGRFFIFAVTALKYIGDTNFTPAEQLQRVLARGATLDDGESAYAQIDALYADILQSATRDNSGKSNARLCQRVSDLLRTIVLLEEPLSVDSLAHLTGVSKLDVSKAVGALSAFLFVAETQDSSMAVVQIFHPSLRDFLCDTERCPDARFFVDAPVHNRVLALRCLLILNQSLVRDICHLKNPARPNSDVPDLALRLQTHVPAAVQYACVFWTMHLSDCQSLSDSVCATLLEFCRVHLFHWVELLSLLSRLPIAAAQLPAVVSWCRSSSISTYGAHEVPELLNNGYRMLLAYYPPIQSYALHVYESAVATMPICALFDTVNNNITAGPRLLSARESGWNATLRIIENDSNWNCVYCVAFSPDGSQLASGSGHGTLKLWSARSGDQLAILKSPGTLGLGSVVSLAFSPDGSQVVCNSEVGTVRLWDTRTYHQIAVPRDRTGDRSRHPGRSPPSAFSPTGAFFVCGSDGGEISVWETATCKKILVLDSIEEMWTVACSPDGNKIVSGSQNGMVRVWDSQTGARLAELEGHDGSVNSVSISPDGSQIASASNDQTIRIWDMRTTGVSVLRGHSDCVNSVAFSPDGRQIVSGSRDQTVRVWDVQSAMEIAVLEGHSIGVLSVAFSPEGAHIASSSADYTIRIWDVQRLPRTVGNDPETTRHIVLSLDGSRVVSTAGKHGRVWDVQSGTQIASLYGHTDKIMAVAFSPEPAGSKTVTSSLDETVRVWDTQSGQQLAVFSVNDNHVDIVALSPDSTRAVCVSNDGTIRVWDVSRSLALAVIPLGESSVSAVALSPDGLQVISSSWAGMTVWDIATGTKVAILGEFGKSRKDGPSAFSFEFSSDGERLYTSHHPAWFRHRSTVGQLPSSYLCQDLVWDFQDVVTPQHSPSPRKVTPITATTTSRASSGRTEGPSQDVILLTWDLMTGWLSCVSNPETEDPTHLCWLPVDRRGDVVVLRGWEAFLGGAGGTLTILDCTDAINRLVGLGIV